MLLITFQRTEKVDFDKFSSVLIAFLEMFFGGPYSPLPKSVPHLSNV